MAGSAFQWSPDACFLCRETGKKLTKEHVFPQWLLDRFDLRTKTLTLLNGTTLPYGQNLIPACAECNNRFLSQLETEVEKASAKGWEAVRDMDPDRLFWWCAKIYYGIMYRELSLKMDIRSPDSGSILEPEFLASYDCLRSFLDSIRISTEYIEGKPYSLFVFPTHTYAEPSANFWYSDLLGAAHSGRLHLATSMRFGGVGIVLVFDDNQHAQNALAIPAAGITGPPLHPTQFIEFTTRVFYGESLRTVVTDYYTMVAPDKPGEPPMRFVACPPLSGNVFAEWDEDTFVGMMREAWINYGVDPSTLPPPQRGRIFSTLQNTDGSFRRMDAMANLLE